MFALIMGVVSAKAQIATQNSNALDNISVGITVGASTPLDFNSFFPVNTNFGLKLQKDFTPAFGIQIEGLAILNDNHFSDLKTFVKGTNVGANAAFNLSNILWGYKGSPRVFEVSTIAGIGWLHEWNTSSNSLTAKTGLDLAFNIGKKKAHSIVITPAVYWNLHKFDAIQFNKQGAQLALNVTYVYHFKTSNGTHNFKTYDVGAMIDEINRLNGALTECQRRTPEVVEKVVEVKAPETNGAVIKSSTQFWVVTFETGSAKISNEDKYILNEIGNDAIVDITATASPDGSAKRNQQLSEERANAVKEYLTNRGVRVNSCQGLGVNPDTGRSAIVKNTQ